MEIITPQLYCGHLCFGKKHRKDVNHSASPQIKQPVKYSHIPDQRNQSECLYRMKILVRKTFKADCHCNQWFAAFWGCNPNWKNKAEVPDWYRRFSPDPTQQICQRTLLKPNTSQPILSQRTKYPCYREAFMDIAFPGLFRSYRWTIMLADTVNPVWALTFCATIWC